MAIPSSRRRRYEKLLQQAREQSLLVVAATTAAGGQAKGARARGRALADCALIEQEIDALIAEQEGDTLAAIDRALLVLRTEPEAFGRCEECGEEIDAAWLDVAPWLAHCARHAQGALAF